MILSGLYDRIDPFSSEFKKVVWPLSAKYSKVAKDLATADSILVVIKSESTKFFITLEEFL